MAEPQQGRGGRLVAPTMAEIDGGDFGYRLVLEASLGALMDLVEIMGLVEEGVIGEDEVRRMSIPPVGRTRADIVRPIASGSGR